MQCEDVDREAAHDGRPIGRTGIRTWYPQSPSWPGLHWWPRAEPCSDVELLFARGTSEPPGIGRVGQALGGLRCARNSGAARLSTYGINYPATYDFFHRRRRRP